MRWGKMLNWTNAKQKEPFSIRNIFGFPSQSGVNYREGGNPEGRVPKILGKSTILSEFAYYQRYTAKEGVRVWVDQLLDNQHTQRK